MYKCKFLVDELKLAQLEPHPFYEAGNSVVSKCSSAGGRVAENYNPFGVGALTLSLAIQLCVVIRIRSTTGSHGCFLFISHSLKLLVMNFSQHGQKVMVLLRRKSDNESCRARHTKVWELYLSPMLVLLSGFGTYQSIQHVIGKGNNI